MENPLDGRERKQLYEVKRLVKSRTITVFILLSENYSSHLVSQFKQADKIRPPISPCYLTGALVLCYCLKHSPSFVV